MFHMFLTIHNFIEMVNLKVETQRVAFDNLENSTEIQGYNFHDLNKKSTVVIS